MSFGKLTLPDHDHPPAKSPEASMVFTVTIYIRHQFCKPEFSIRLRNRTILALGVHVPETAIDKYYCLVLGKHYVWLARQVVTMNSES